MSRRLGSLLILLPLIAGPAQASETPRPNVVVVLVDDMGFSVWEAAVIVLLLSGAFLLPNTQELMRDANPALDRATSRSRLVWASTPAWACAVGALFALVVFSLGHVSEFLYFQF